MAEWEYQDVVLISFPHKNSDWKLKLNKIIPTYINIINKISLSQKVYIFCDEISIVKKYFKSNQNIEYYQILFNDTWIRDYGFIRLEENNIKILLNFKFNAWGGKYKYLLDDAFNNKIYKKINNFKNKKMVNIDFILEGGSIDCNGEGTIITTLSSLCNKNRNKNLNKIDVEHKLKIYFGIDKILWLKGDYLIGDDTDGHIDMIARFVSKNTIIYNKSYDTNDKHFDKLKNLEKELIKINNQNNNIYKLIPIILPSAIFNESNKQLPANYINFLIINKAILYPIYLVKEDLIAKEIFTKIFPNRDIIPINSLALIEEGGAIHCSTMQI